MSCVRGKRIIFKKSSEPIKIWYLKEQREGRAPCEMLLIEYGRHNNNNNPSGGDLVSRLDAM